MKDKEFLEQCENHLIEMENKYYVPEIEEFHIGYELEWKIEKNTFENYPSNLEVYDWQKHTLTLEDFQMDELCSDFHNIHNSRIKWRTKYLDKKDIESLHYKYKRVYQNELSFEKGDIYQIGGEFLDYDTNTKNLNIVRNQGKFDNSGTPLGKTVFQGKVKSLNELTKLLKMICY